MFDEAYYKRVIAEFGYDPLDFRPIDFSLGSLDRDILRWKWLCHSGCDYFADAANLGARCIVTTGFGLSGTPHLGTISQMLSAITLQRAGFYVQIVLGDLDAYNARAQDLSTLTQRAIQYREFIIALGFDISRGVLRTQLERQDILLYAYLLARYATDADFTNTEEDLSRLYIQHGVYRGIDFPVKHAILLMIADFLHAGKTFDHVLIMLGIDEHRYVRLARELARRSSLVTKIASLYSRMNRGLKGFPKMSKSLPGSAITPDLPPERIRHLLVNEANDAGNPLECPVFQLMCATGNYTAREYRQLFDVCVEGGTSWARAKHIYVDTVLEVCSKWPI